MLSSQDSIDFQWLSHMLRRWLWLILSLALIAGVIAFAVTSFIPASYQSTTTLMIKTSASSQSSEYNNIIAGERLALTYSQMLEGRPVLEQAIVKLGIPETLEDLEKQVTAEPIRDTQLIRLSVSRHDPKEAALLANAVAETFVQHMKELQQERYQVPLANVQDNMDALQAKIDAAQSEVNTLTLKSNEEDVELTRLQTTLAEYRNDLRSFQQNSLSLQLSMDQATGNIYVVQPAQTQLKQMYSSTASVELLVGQSPFAGGDLNQTVSSDQLTKTYDQLLNKGQVFQATIDELGLSLMPSDLSKKVSVELLPGTKLIRLNAQNENEQQAILIADTVAKHFVDQLKRMLSEPYTQRNANLQTQMSNLNEQIKTTEAEIRKHSSARAMIQTDLARAQNSLLESRTSYQSFQQDYQQLSVTAAEGADTILITEPAHIPHSPVLNKQLYTLFAVVIGMVIGLALAFALEILDDRINSPEDVVRKLGLTLLGTIGKISAKEDKLVVVKEPLSYIAENYRVLSTNIHVLKTKKHVNTLLITSPTPREGKSVTTANLAVVLAQGGLSVLVVDADLRLPTLHIFFDLENQKGFSNLLMEENMEGLPLHEVQGVKVITSGDVALSPHQLKPQRLLALMQRFTQEADIVLIDCAPVLSCSDTLNLAALSDGVVLVMRTGQAEGNIAREAIQVLSQVNANILGVVLNEVHGKLSSYYSERQKKGNLRLSGKNV